MAAEGDNGRVSQNIEEKVRRMMDDGFGILHELL